MQRRLGILNDAIIPMKETIECAKRAEASGFETIWVSDMAPREAFVQLTACALTTERIKLGTSVAVASVRHPMIMAGSVAGLDELSGGRTILGLGVGSTWIADAGVTADRPVGYIKEYVEVTRRILRGGDFPFKGERFSVRGLNSWNRIGYRPPRSQVPIYTGAVGRRMLEAAGEVADGVILGSINNIDYIRMARGHLETGARRAGRDVSSVDFGALLLTFVGRDSGAMKKLARARVASYGALPSYSKTLRLMGYGTERERIVEAIGRGDTAAAVQAVPEKMADDITLAGTVEECREKLERYREAGLAHPILYPILTEGRKPSEVYGPALEI